MTFTHPVDVMLRKLECCAEGCRLLSTKNGDKDIYMCGEAIDKIVSEYRSDIKTLHEADTKRDLEAVKLPGEDAYEVEHYEPLTCVGAADR